MPPYVRVAHVDITLADWDPKAASAQHRWAEFSVQEMAIRIETTGRQPVEVVASLMHELTHAICWAYEVRTVDDLDKAEHPDTEERIAGIFGTAWAQIYRDNPDLLKYIRDLFRSDPRHGPE